GRRSRTRPAPPRRTRRRTRRRIRPQAGGARARPGHPRPPTHPHRTRRVQRDVVGALLVQILPRLAARAADEGALGHPRPRRERRRHRHRRRPRRRLQDGVAQPPELHRALPRRRHRRRRHPARRVHHGRPPRSQPERAPLRLARQPPHQAHSGRRGARHRRLRQLRRRPHGRRRGELPPGLRRQPARQRHDRRHSPRGPHLHRESDRRRQPRGLRRQQNRPRRHPRRHHGERRIQRRLGGETPYGPDRRPVHREAPDRGLPGADGNRRHRRHPGHGRRRPHLLLRRDGRQGRHGHRTRPRRRAPARNRHERLRDDALGVAGAHADGAPPRPRGRSGAHLPQMGTGLRGDRPPHRHRPHRPPPQRHDRGRHSPRAPRIRSAPVPPPHRRNAEATGARRRHGFRPGRHRACAAPLGRQPRPLLPPLDLGPVRQHGGRPDRQPPRRRRRSRGPHRGPQPRTRPHHRRHPALLPGRPRDRRRPGRGRGLAQHHRRRRPPARDHGQHELRQPRAPGDHGPVRRLHPRHGRRLHGARLPRRVRQRLPLQRDARPGRRSPRHSPHPRHRRRRRAGGRGASGRPRPARRHGLGADRQDRGLAWPIPLAARDRRPGRRRPAARGPRRRAPERRFCPNADPRAHRPRLPRLLRRRPARGLGRDGDGVRHRRHPSPRPGRRPGTRPLVRRRPSPLHPRRPRRLAPARSRQRRRHSRRPPRAIRRRGLGSVRRPVHIGPEPAGRPRGDPAGPDGGGV
ncbi:MAG: Phosphoribosylformylglycinamidine synthase, synthetase subunit, partial [uncultured Acetobacteraceae bacterium]